MSDFFAEIDPNLYDLSIACVVPHLAMHRSARAKVFQSLMTVASRELTGADLGVGTGEDLLALIEPLTIGTIYAFDDSENMVSGLHRRLALRMGGPKIFYRQCDLGDPASPAISRALEESEGGLEFVTSSFVVHNLPLERQLAAFRNARRLLRAGGLFFYMDLFCFQDLALSAVAAKYDADFIHYSFANVPFGVNEKQWAMLRDRWLEHYRSENNLIPLGGSGVSVRAFLCEAGFRSVEVVSRCFQAGLLLCKA